MLNFHPDGCLRLAPESILRTDSVRDTPLTQKSSLPNTTAALSLSQPVAELA